MTQRLPLFGALVWLAALVGLSTAGPASAATFVVKNTNDSGADSLRAAIKAANATAALDTITFNIPGAAGHVIGLTTPLPAITHPIVVNGKTQPGYSGKPLVQLDNLTGSSIAVGLDVKGGSSEALGLSVTGFATGVQLRDGDGDTVAACWLGLDLNGAAPGGSAIGVLSRGGSNANVIGGTTPADRNVISGNLQGVVLDGVTGNVVEGNYVGTDPKGQAPIGNTVGVAFTAGASANRVGGTTSGARNVIADYVDGVELDGAGTKKNVVEGNYIGLTASGHGRLGGDKGVVVDAPSNTIGGTSAGARNVIAANGVDNVHVTVNGSGNVIAGNYLGTDPTGTLALGGAQIGVALEGDGNTVGGTSAGARNVIAAGGFGIATDADDNVIQGNYIGVDKTGASVLRNNDGIGLLGGTGTIIGGTTAGAGNVISGNRNDGVVLGSQSSGAKIEGNRIGPAASGSALLGNGGNGIKIVNVTDTTIGGTTAAAANVIAGNVQDGVLVDGSGGTTVGNAILGNSIHDDFRSIELVSGANDGQVAPIVGTVTTAGATTTIP